MILALNIQNIALVNQIEIDFENGLNILTGETGAGKSIVIDSVFLLLGGRANKDIIRRGEERAIVEGIFLVNSNKDKIKDALDEMGISIEEDETIIVNREITSNGRNYCRVNGRIVPLSFLDKLGSYLVDILGQHEHQYLLNSSRHMQLLDSFADQEFFRLKKELKKLFTEYKNLQTELDEFFVDEKDKQSVIDLINFQIEEIEKANLNLDEEKILNEKRNILINAEKLFNLMNTNYNLIYEGNVGCGSILDNLHIVLKNLESVIAIDESLTNLKTIIEENLYELEDSAIQIRDYTNQIDFNQEALDKLEERIEFINDLKRKYGKTVEEILHFKEQKKKELQNILQSEQKIKELKNKMTKINNQIIELCETISIKRKNIAESLEKSINKILSELNMPNAIFKVGIDKLEVPNENGIDNVEFLISTNVGEPLKPLSKIASGGELSRIMLALKTILADSDGIPTLIFDEVDTGISGKAAQSVAEKMVYISKKHQVICVTHLPQIASMADSHYKVSKIEENEKTVINIDKLDYNGRIKELSRIISGSRITQTTLEHSKELIEMANKFKNRF
ncbi:MAG: DNA repair protein RecN [Thermoanaerobacteraceae bacterium]